MRSGGNHRVMRSGRRESGISHIERLARFSGATLTDPVAFGGGSDVAAVGLRAQTVAYGYLAVVEDYQHPRTGAQWCTLSVTLPNGVPFLVLDHRAALGQHAVPISGHYTSLTGDPDFDDAYIVTADDTVTVARLLGPDLRTIMVRLPIQRLMFSSARLLLRTFDGTVATPEVTNWLDEVASAVLASTPAFVSRIMSPDAGPGGRPFPLGLYGPNE